MSLRIVPQVLIGQCAITKGGALHCTNSEGELPVPSGSFATLDADRGTYCGVRTALLQQRRRAHRRPANRDGWWNRAGGAISAFGGAEPPEGWLLCDRSSLVRRSYPALFKAIGPAWGAPSGAGIGAPAN